MKKTVHDITVLALHLRLQRFGFAVLKPKPRLLDWGIKSYREPDLTRRQHLVEKRVTPLLKLYRPAVVVANSMSVLKLNRDFAQDYVIRAIRGRAQEYSVHLSFIDKPDIRRVFCDVGATTKQEVAAYVALVFPELTWKLPSPKKLWESEHHNMAIFDAIALGLAYLALTNDLPPGSSNTFQRETLAS